MESRDDQRRGGGNPAPATTYIILSRSGAGYLGSYVCSPFCKGRFRANYPNLQALRGDVNSVRERIANTREQHESFLAYAEGTIGDIENINSAEVIVRMQNDELILQAAYSAIAELRSLSLLNYL